MLTLLKLGLSGYDVKPRFCAFMKMRTSPTKSTFFLGEIFLMTLDTYAKKITTVDRLGGRVGVHGKVCWLIAYYYIDSILSHLASVAVRNTMIKRRKCNGQ